VRQAQQLLSKGRGLDALYKLCPFSGLLLHVYAGEHACWLPSQNWFFWLPAALLLLLLLLLLVHILAAAFAQSQSTNFLQPLTLPPSRQYEARSRLGEVSLFGCLAADV
jgi:hypothetical protein